MNTIAVFFAGILIVSIVTITILALIWINDREDDAVEAIEALPSAQQDVTDTNVGDMINRQAAISRAVTITMFGRDIRVVGVSELESLPSAQPDLDEWCTDCKEYDFESLERDLLRAEQ